MQILIQEAQADKFQVILTLLVQGPHSEQQIFNQSLTSVSV